MGSTNGICVDISHSFGMLGVTKVPLIKKEEIIKKGLINLTRCLCHAEVI